MRLASPPPGFCSCCFNSPQPDQRFVDFEADYDGAPVLDKDSGGIAILPWDGQLGGHDNLYLCDSCVRDAAELLAFTPEAESRLRVELRDAQARAAYWEENTKRLEKYLADRPESSKPTGPPAPRARRKVAV